MQTVAKAIAGTLAAIENCTKSGNAVWLERHRARLDSVIKEYMPSGSGFDNGTTLDPSSTPERLEFRTSFHHMNESGMYAGWTDHRIIVTPSMLFDFNIRVTGRDRNAIRDYIAEGFADALRQECKPAKESV